MFTLVGIETRDSKLTNYRNIYLLKYCVQGRSKAVAREAVAEGAGFRERKNC